MTPKRTRSKLFPHVLLPTLSKAEVACLQALATINILALSHSIAQARMLILMQAMRLHRLLGVFEYVYERSPAIQGVLSNIPEATLWTEEWKAHARVNDQTHSEARRVTKILRAASVTTALLKGAVVGPRCYPRASMRPMSDVDALVCEHQLTIATRVLVNEGYVPVPIQERNGPSRNIHGDQLWHPVRKIVVELHHRIANSDLLSFRTLIDRGEYGHGSDGYDLSPTVHFLHRLLDIAKDGCLRVGILPYLDVIRMCDTWFLTSNPYASCSLVQNSHLAIHVARASYHLHRHFAHLCELPITTGAIGSIPKTMGLLDMMLETSDSIWRIRYTPRWLRRCQEFTWGRVG